MRGPEVTVAAAAGERPPTYAGDIRILFFAVVRLADLAALTATGVLSYWARHGVVALPTEAWWVVVATCLIAANTMHFGRIYGFESLRRRSRHLGAVALAWMASVFSIIVLLYFTKTGEQVSRAWMLTWGITGLAGFVLLRALCWTWLDGRRRKGVFVFNVAVVGETGAAERLARRIEEAGEDDAHVVGTFRPDTPADLTALLELGRKVRIDEIAVAVPCTGALDLSNILRLLSSFPADIKLCIDLPTPLPLASRSVHLPTVLLASRPVAGWQMMIKRSMDVVISTVMLIAFSPLLLAIALAIMLDSPGPALFRQRRFGFNKRPITIYKFRTMHVGAAKDPSVPQATRGDPRVTRVGRFLRANSLDELPQLFNVLLGSMSLVGPRPHAIAHDEHFAQLIDGYLARHRVKPGITGWAQTNGFRGETETIEKMQGRLQYDLYYIAHWSPLLDLRILAKTTVVGFRHRNAY